jgi:D-hydroxyproline dehydrogenase subunit gamma
MNGGRIVRLAEMDRARLMFEIDGMACTGLAGDSVLTAMLANVGHVRLSDSEDKEPRAGFCLMGACQDCWVWTAQGNRLRACTTPLAAGMRIVRHRAAQELHGAPS